MSRSLSASDRSALIRMASTLPKGSPERKAILAGLRTEPSRVAAPVGPRDIAKLEQELDMMEAEHDSLMRMIKSLG